MSSRRRTKKHVVEDARDLGAVDCLEFTLHYTLADKAHKRKAQ